MLCRKSLGNQYRLIFVNDKFQLLGAQNLREAGSGGIVVVVGAVVVVVVVVSVVEVTVAM